MYQECTEARRKLDAIEVQELSQVEIERLAAIAYHDELKEDEDKRNEGLNNKDREEYGNLLQTIDFEFRQRIAHGDTQSLEEYANELLPDRKSVV